MKYEEIFCATFKAIRKTLDPEEVRRSVDFSIPSMPMVKACRADDFDFFASIIMTGHLTVEQMHHACQRYYLGKTKSGQPIFWMIDDMLTPLDAHIGTTWISTLLKVREPLIASWCVTHSLFGLHLLSPHSPHTDLTDLSCERSLSGERNPFNSCNPLFLEKTVCIVESEQSAVILSEIFQEYVWMA